MNKLCLSVLLSILFLMTSCVTKKQVLYFQDTDTEVVDHIPSPQPFIFRPGDLISIKVSSRDPQMSEAFNVSTSMDERTSAYLIDSKGYVKIPILGNVLVKGKDREQISEEIEALLVKHELLKDPIVMIGYVNFGASILGEVGHPGRFLIENDHTTILDVLSQQGDLTICGNRKRVKVIRQEDDKLNTYLVDMRSVKSIYNSPVYYIRPDDVIYVEPNTSRSGSSSVNGNNVRSISFWTSMGAMIMSIFNYFK
jgi:polysaccharide export outer membrane protein